MTAKNLEASEVEQGSASKGSGGRRATMHTFTMPAHIQRSGRRCSFSQRGIISGQAPHLKRNSISGQTPKNEGSSTLAPIADDESIPATVRTPRPPAHPYAPNKRRVPGKRLAEAVPLSTRRHQTLQLSLAKLGGLRPQPPFYKQVAREKEPEEYTEPPGSDSGPESDDSSVSSASEKVRETQADNASGKTAAAGISPGYPDSTGPTRQLSEGSGSTAREYETRRVSV